MLDSKTREIITECARKYDVKKVILFGSGLYESSPGDIDLGVDGLAPEVFFKFYAEIYRKCTLPVDLIDLSINTMFNKLIMEEGKVIYDRSESKDQG